MILACFSRRINKPCVTFSRVWTKNTNCWEILRKLWTFWSKFNRKIQFLLIFGYFLLKLEGGHEGLSDYRTLQGVVNPSDCVQWGVNPLPLVPMYDRNRLRNWVAWAFPLLWVKAVFLRILAPTPQWYGDFRTLQGQQPLSLLFSAEYVIRQNH